MAQNEMPGLPHHMHGSRFVMFTSGDFSRLTQPQRAIVLAKPFWRMRCFASLLGWKGLQLEWVSFTEEEATRFRGVPESRVFVSYVTTDQEFHIQINELPPHDGRLHQAAIDPFCYGFTLLAWYKFELFDNDTDLIAEADRLRPYLDRQQFRDPIRRAAFKKAHPELLLTNVKRTKRR